MNANDLPAVVSSNRSVYYQMSDLEKMAGAMAKSQLFGVKNADQALALMLVAQAEGQHPATIAQDYDIVQNRPARKTHSVLARFQQAGGTVQWHEVTETKARATFSHRSGGSLEIEWTLDMAKRAGLTGKDNWKNYPRAMLRARCIAEGIRAVFPGAIGGMLVAEEAQDIEHVEKDITPAPVELAPYDAEAFKTNLPKWQKLIEGGKKTPADIIATIESKHRLTEEQKQGIEALAQPAAPIEGEVLEPGSAG